MPQGVTRRKKDPPQVGRMGRDTIPETVTPRGPAFPKKKIGPIVRFQQTSPSGMAEVDTRCLLFGTDGKVWVCSGSPTNHGLTPMTEEMSTAVRNHIGDGAWLDIFTALGHIYFND